MAARGQASGQWPGWCARGPAARGVPNVSFRALPRASCSMFLAPRGGATSLASVVVLLGGTSHNRMERHHHDKRTSLAPAHHSPGSRGTAPALTATWTGAAAATAPPSASNHVRWGDRPRAQGRPPPCTNHHRQPTNMKKIRQSTARLRHQFCRPRFFPHAAQLLRREVQHTSASQPPCMQRRTSSANPVATWRQRQLQPPPAHPVLPPQSALGTTTPTWTRRASCCGPSRSGHGTGIGVTCINKVVHCTMGLLHTICSAAPWWSVASEVGLTP